MLESAKDKTLICFGAGDFLHKTCESFADVSFFERIDFIADNNQEKHSFVFRGAEKPVCSIEHCLEQAVKEPVIYIAILNCFDVLGQLDAIPALRDCDCFFFALLREWLEPYSLPCNRAQNEPRKIPKTIHYCWFGGSPIPDQFLEYMKSWKKYCPDYEIVRWDESNYDYKKNEYMYEAYKQKKWGFVPDYARLDIINTYGGVYLDTDVELVRSIDDLLCDEAFCGFESGGFLANGLGFGAEAGFPHIEGQMEAYGKLSFVNPDGSLNMTPGPRYQSEYFRSKGVRLDNSLQKLDGITLYPSDVLAPLGFYNETPHLTGNTYSIHHYAATWFSQSRNEERRRIAQGYAWLRERLE
jgi:hypothetical protein